MIPAHQLFSAGLKPEVCFCLFTTPAHQNKKFLSSSLCTIPMEHYSRLFKANGSSLNSAKMAVTALLFCPFQIGTAKYLYLFLIRCQLLPFFTNINIPVNYRNQGVHNPFNYPSTDLSADKQSQSLHQVLSLNLLPNTSQRPEFLSWQIERRWQPATDNHRITRLFCKRDGHFSPYLHKMKQSFGFLSLLNPLLQRVRSFRAPLRGACSFLRLKEKRFPVCLYLFAFIRHIHVSVPFCSTAFFKHTFWYSCLVVQGKTWEQAIFCNTDTFLMI